ncbi:MAG: hypothetical protein M0Q48_07685 [Verrucomicrobia bacterium]|nr:hypothetical protein [Verrucomicrobiota bacterium]
MVTKTDGHGNRRAQRKMNMEITERKSFADAPCFSAEIGGCDPCGVVRGVGLMSYPGSFPPGNGMGMETSGTGPLQAHLPLLRKSA